MVFNTYGREATLKSGLHGGELVETNIHVTNVKRDSDNESMQSVQLVFGDGTESPDISPDVVENPGGEAGEDDEDEDRRSTGSGMEVKIDLLADEQKDTAL